MLKTVRATCIVLILLSGGALATGSYSLEKSSGVVEALKSLIRMHTTRGFVAWFESALSCDKPGEMIYIIPGGPDDTGTYCNESGKIHAVNAGINYGLIERFKAVGIPIDWLRAELANPALLKAAYELIGADTINEVVRAALTGKYAEHFVYTDKESNAVDRSRLDDLAKEYLQGFILRRISEARPKDRPEIARIWGEIINEQVDYLLVDPALIPEIKSRK